MRVFSVLARAAGFLGLCIVINSCGGGGSPAGPAPSPAPSPQPVAPNITTILPSVPVVSPAEQRLTVNGTGLSAVTSISLTRPGGDVSTITGDKLGDISETSLAVMATLATPGAYALQASTATGSRSNSRTFDVSAPAEQGGFSTATTNTSGEAVVAVSGVGNVPVAVRDQGGQGVSNATVVAHPGGIAVAAEGYTTTVIIATPATLRARSLSWSSVVISLSKTACAVKSALLDCTGLDLASHLAVGSACKAYESIDATFSCVEAPNMHRNSLVAQALVLNSGNFIDQLLSRIPLVGCGLWLLDETRGFSIQSYYVNLANRWYPELRGTEFLVVSTDTTDIFTPYACPVPLFPRALGEVSGGQWRGTFNWDTPNLMLRDERVRIWRGDACAGSELQSISSQVGDALRELSLASAARPLASVRRSVEATLPEGAYAWRVESTRLDGSIETTECSKLAVGSSTPPAPTPPPPPPPPVPPGPVVQGIEVLPDVLGLQSGTQFTFMAIGAADPALNYLWDFGDGTPTVKEQVPRHVFTKTGTFDVRVTVSDGRGGSATAVRSSLRVSDVTGAWTGTFDFGSNWPEAACGPRTNLNVKMTLTQTGNTVSGSYADQFNTGRVRLGQIFSGEPHGNRGLVDMTIAIDEPFDKRGCFSSIGLGLFPNDTLTVLANHGFSIRR